MKIEHEGFRAESLPFYGSELHIPFMDRIIYDPTVFRHEEDLRSWAMTRIRALMSTLDKGFVAFSGENYCQYLAKCESIRQQKDNPPHVKEFLDSITRS